MVMSPTTRSCSHRLSNPNSSVRVAKLRICPMSVGPSKNTWGNSMPQGKRFAMVSQLLDIILVHHEGHEVEKIKCFFARLERGFVLRELRVLRGECLI